MKQEPHVHVQYANKVLFTIKLHLHLSQKQYLIIISWLLL
jgi:hypothetical protein